MKSLLALKQHCIGVNVRLSLCPSDILMKLFDDIENDIANLQATIEAQEIIIKDKSAIMDSMAQPKTCEGCKHFFEDDFAGCILYENDFTRCSRQFENDHYEPKAQP